MLSTADAVNIPLRKMGGQTTPSSVDIAALLLL